MERAVYQSHVLRAGGQRQVPTGSWHATFVLWLGRGRCGCAKRRFSHCILSDKNASICQDRLGTNKTPTQNLSGSFIGVFASQARRRRSFSPAKIWSIGVS